MQTTRALSRVASFAYCFLLALMATATEGLSTCRSPVTPFSKMPLPTGIPKFHNVSSLKIALVTVSFSDVDAPTTDAEALNLDQADAPHVHEFVRSATNGCVEYEFTGIFHAKLNHTQLDDASKCRAKSPYDHLVVKRNSLSLADTNYNASEYHVTVFHLLYTHVKCGRTYLFEGHQEQYRRYPDYMDFLDREVVLDSQPTQIPVAMFLDSMFPTRPGRLPSDYPPYWNVVSLGDNGGTIYDTHIMFGANITEMSFLHNLFHILGHTWHSGVQYCQDHWVTDNRECRNVEGEDPYDLMGNPVYAMELSARSRYFLGWFGQEHVAFVDKPQSLTLGALSNPNSPHKRAAVVWAPTAEHEEDDAIWVEYRDGTGFDSDLLRTRHWYTPGRTQPGYELEEVNATSSGRENVNGVMLMIGEHRIDGHRSNCKGYFRGSTLSDDRNPWCRTEAKRVSVNVGEVYIDSAFGAVIRVDAVGDGSVNISVSFNDVSICKSAPPMIRSAPYYIGEWRPWTWSSKVDIAKLQLPLYSDHAVFGMQLFAGDGPAPACGCPPAGGSSFCDEMGYFGLDFEHLPFNWSATVLPSAGGSTSPPNVLHKMSYFYNGYRNVDFALGLPSDTPSGVFDMCVLAYNAKSGLQTAAPLRVTLPNYGDSVEVIDDYDPAPTVNCSQYIGCRQGFADCVVRPPKQPLCNATSSKVVDSELFFEGWELAPSEPLPPKSVAQVGLLPTADGKAARFRRLNLVDGDYIEEGVIAVAAGNFTRLAVLPDGRVVSWGRPNVTDVDLGSSVGVATDRPVIVDGLSNIVDVAVGGTSGQNLALTDTGGVKMWTSSIGATGGATVDVIPSGSGVVAIAAGGSHHLALVSDQYVNQIVWTDMADQHRFGWWVGDAGLVKGSVVAWGDNALGQLGANPTISPNSATPVAVVGVGSGVVSIAAGGSHSLVALETGQVRAWGSNSRGQLGNDSSQSSSSTPVNASITAATAVNLVVACLDTSMALTTDQRILMWGANDYGQLGDGTRTDRHAPKEVWTAMDGDGAPLTAEAISCSGRHSVAIVRLHMTVYTWGSNEYGQLGDGSTVDRLIPIAPANIRGSAHEERIIRHAVDRFAAGLTFTVMASEAVARGPALPYDSLATIGRHTVGNNPAGVIDANPTILANHPAIQNAVALAAGYSASGWVVTANGTVFTWGSSWMQGNADAEDVSFFEPVLLQGISNAVDVSVGYEGTHFMILLSTGGIKTWGGNGHGALGYNVTWSEEETPVDVVGLGGRAVAISAGEYFSMALLDDGRVQTWGANSLGQLGDGTTTDRFAPVDVVGLSDHNVTGIAAGAFWSLALLSNGSVVSWGDNGWGGLGRPVRRSTTPVYVVGLENVTVISIACHYFGSFALTSTGGVKTWGANWEETLLSRPYLAGQTWRDRYFFAAVPTDAIGLTSGVAAISCHYHCIALMTDGSVRVWGVNEDGRLGVVSPEAIRDEPSRVYRLHTNIKLIAAGPSASFFITSSEPNPTTIPTTTAAATTTTTTPTTTVTPTQTPVAATTTPMPLAASATIAPTSGTYNNSVLVTISCPSGYLCLYTTDGSEPLVRRRNLISGHSLHSRDSPRRPLPPSSRHRVAFPRQTNELAGSSTTIRITTAGTHVVMVRSQREGYRLSPTVSATFVVQMPASLGCPVDHYGPSCVHCVAADLCSGNGYCGGETGICVCDSGYFDVNCTTYTAPLVPTVTATVSAENGGSLSSSSGTTLSIPAGALPAGISVELTSTEYAASAMPSPPSSAIDATIEPVIKTVSTVKDFGPDGLVFEKPINCTIPYDAAAITTADNVQVMTYDTVTQTWVAIGGSVDPVTNSVTASLTHFSLYAAFEITPPTGQQQQQQQTTLAVMPTPTPGDDDGGGGALSTKAIAGISVGCVGAAGIIVSILLYRRSHPATVEGKSAPPALNMENPSSSSGAYRGAVPPPSIPLQSIPSQQQQRQAASPAPRPMQRPSGVSSPSMVSPPTYRFKQAATAVRSQVSVVNAMAKLAGVAIQPPYSRAGPPPLVTNTRLARAKPSITTFPQEQYRQQSAAAPASITTLPQQQSQQPSLQM